MNFGAVTFPALLAVPAPAMITMELIVLPHVDLQAPMRLCHNGQVALSQCLALIQPTRSSAVAWIHWVGLILKNSALSGSLVETAVSALTVSEQLAMPSAERYGEASCPTLWPPLILT